MTIKLACEQFISNIDAINAKCDADMAALDASHEAAERDRAARHAAKVEAAWETMRNKRAARHIEERRQKFEPTGSFKR
jgi:hypothetical protein